MKVGSLVKLKVHPRGGLNRTAVIVDVVHKKCWRTDKLGHAVSWNKVDPEPHGVILLDNEVLTIPATDLEVINESR